MYPKKCLKSRQSENYVEGRKPIRVPRYPAFVLRLSVRVSRRDPSLTLRALLPSKLPSPRSAQENQTGRGSGLSLEVNE
jgi:hypothetical protein